MERLWRSHRWTGRHKLMVKQAPLCVDVEFRREGLSWCSGTKGMWPPQNSVREKLLCIDANAMSLYSSRTTVTQSSYQVEPRTKHIACMKRAVSHIWQCLFYSVTARMFTTWDNPILSIYYRLKRLKLALKITQHITFSKITCSQYCRD